MDIQSLVQEHDDARRARRAAERQFHEMGRGEAVRSGLVAELVRLSGVETRARAALAQARIAAASAALREAADDTESPEFRDASRRLEAAKREQERGDAGFRRALVDVGAIA